MPGTVDLVEADEADERRILEESHDLLGRSDVECHLVRGEPGPTICEFADEIGADVVILGTSGRGGLRRAVLGSPCPVLTIN